MTCRWVSSTEPRAVIGRHEPECADETCRGCQPCSMGHCRICGRVHADGTCAECLATTRADLHEIARLCHALPEEVAHRGVEGEAMMLLGPVADPEQWGHTEASIAVGRLPKDWLETADGELHPLFVLGTWDATWRDALEHSEPTGAVTLALAVDYLDRTLTYMAAYEHVPFEDFAKDLRKCVGRLEAVLHDGEQVDMGAPCMACDSGVRLIRTWASDENDDGWRCPQCRRTSTRAQYDLAVKADYIKRAEWLAADDMAIRTSVKAATVRSWARERRDKPPLVRKVTRAERVVYSVEDVLREKARMVA